MVIFNSYASLPEGNPDGRFLLNMMLSWVSMPVNGWQTIHGLAGILSESEETDQLRHQTRIKPVSDVGNFTAMAPINMCTQIVWFRLNKHILSCIYIIQIIIYLHPTFGCFNGVSHYNYSSQQVR